VKANRTRPPYITFLRGCILSLLTVCFSWSIQAEGNIDGVIEFPKPRGGTAATQRYKADKALPPPPPLAAVWIEGDFGDSKASGKTASLPQKGFQFERSLLVVQAGTAVTFPNHDEDYHSVFSYSKTREFDLGRYRKSEKPPEIVFDTPGEVKLYCEIH